MSATITLTPIAPGEIETICFDYGLLLQGESLTITSVLSMDCLAITGFDANASTRLIGGAVISSSRETGAPSSAVLQQVGYMVNGVTYLLHCVAGISDGQRLSLSGRLASVQVYGYTPPDDSIIVAAVGVASGIGGATGVSATGVSGGVPLGLLFSLMG